MLLYGGIGLLVGGIVSALFGDRLSKDPATAARMKKQGPLLAVVGAVLLLLRLLLG